MVERLKQLKAVYDRFVLENVANVTTAEQLGKSMSYILPSSVPDTELTSEFLYTSFKLVSFYNDILIAKHYLQGPQQAVKLASRYTAAHLNNPVYQRIAFVLTFFQNIELLAEIGASRVVGQKYKWRVVLLIEAIKMVCRLLLLRLTRNRMVLRSMIPDAVRTVDQQTLHSARGEPPSVLWTGERSKREHATLSAVKAFPSEKPGESRAAQFVANQFETLSAGPAVILAPLDRLRLIAEILFAVRPVVYVLAVMRFGTTSWKPWVVSLLIEGLSRYLPLQSSQRPTATEVEEYNSRSNLLLYYLIRVPMLNAVTKEMILDLAGLLDKLPLLSLASNALRDYMRLWEKYYFYTSAS